MDDFDIHEYFSVLKRRKLAYFLTFAALLALSMLMAVTWSRYRSIAVVQVQQRDIPEEMTAPIGADISHLMENLADQQIQQIQQVVTSTSSLVEIIQKFHLYSGQLESQPLADVAATMRKKIKLELTSADLSNPASASRMSAGDLSAIAFELSFTYNDPLKTQQVTNELVSRFLDEDLKRRRAQTHETLVLLDSQLAALEATMAEQEKKVAEFRSKFAESRPESLAVNQQAAMTTYLNLQSVQSQLSALEKSRGDMRAQLATVDPYSRVVADGQVLTTPAIQLKALQAKYASISGQYGPEHPDVIKLRHQIMALQADAPDGGDSATLKAQISDTQSNLAAAQRTYGPDHPDVRALRQQLASLEDALARTPPSSRSHQDLKGDADNPAYLMLVSQLKALDDQQRSLTTQRDALQAQYDRYQQNVAQTPANEQEFAALSRDYDNAQLRYRELKQKRLSAEMNEQMEAGRKGARLTVVDPPALPTKTSPSKFILIVAGFMGSAFGGLGGVVLAEVLSRNVHGPKQITTIMGEPPLVVIPFLFTNEDRLRRRKRRLWALATVVVTLAISLILVDQFVVPLDVLF